MNKELTYSFQAEGAVLLDFELRRVLFDDGYQGSRVQLGNCRGSRGRRAVHGRGGSGQIRELFACVRLRTPFDGFTHSSGIVAALRR